ncbi:hypothetical protein BEH70_23455 [Citrobacter freundii]|nr:hypothetical protein LI64_23820 [Enterobacter hormaechei subsp. hormaechei]KJN96990.1 hypothetical protein SS00_22455 [Enterobacter hormaechei subsp. hormaechei]KTJ25556.1 hypothetical protein ASU86_24855 [Enterobacter hormaechei subsp. steigerwaltii]KYC17732.1 hypothetical protein WM45_17020 [Citrobacter sp. AATXR]OIZ36216.1 hypothetical protein BEH70_23455 [Citrobacter freundii]
MSQLIQLMLITSKEFLAKKFVTAMCYLPLQESMQVIVPGWSGKWTQLLEMEFLLLALFPTELREFLRL